MDEQPQRPPRGRRLLALMAVVGALATIPAGVAIAESESGNGSADSSTGSVQAESGRQDRGDRDRGDRGDCPEKRGGGSEQQSSIEL
jgi:hypothetical protein